MNVNPIEMQKALGGMDYPASKQDIIDRASSNKADRDIIDALESLPDQEFDSPASVSREISKHS
ncbi:DUF2795 domain-containing protein [Streptomyces sp. ME01-24h]|nr:DUF2795 domain-containing protein [Streptomyces sp. ME19-03-3]MDX3234137.1 DUF2795 domain-containing protein [Streptomyces sp. ME03-5709C]MDX3352610.1 DUF2795 domain-containing protein [Streptomyces sp. ME01-24h]